MLEDVLAHIHNRFEVARIVGTFEIVGGTFEVDGAQDGQYVWIEGSVFNDGLHQYPMGGLTDEVFRGRVLLLAVPRAVVEIADEIADWCADNASAIDGPYKSESFGGYTYTKDGGDGSGITADGWMLHFRSRLNRWRKLA